ncbi:MAG: hypothetical protein E6Q97_03370 [Desulfurellales bacterium]|nr:MAG: hypothetical protein E6Q97_03370 [Desulfurellales bacterium]
MASNYKVATGAGVALVSLAAMTPQPKSEGVRYARRTHSADSALHQEGAYIELVWSMIEDQSAYATLLTQFGLGSATYATVTVYVPNERYIYTRYNGVALLPEASQRDYFIRDVVIVVRDLSAL